MKFYYPLVTYLLMDNVTMKYCNPLRLFVLEHGHFLTRRCRFGTIMSMLDERLATKLLC